MTRDDWLWRSAGAALFGAAGLISLLHKHVAAEAAGRPPSGWVALLAFLSFVVATLGAVLLLNGARLASEWRAMREERRRSGRPPLRRPR